jgi:hypothetical protein
MMQHRKIIGFLIAFSVLTGIAFGAGERLWLTTCPTQGCYGMTYNPADGRMYYINATLRYIRIVSSDSLLAQYGTIPTPNSDSMCTDIKYCAYDNTFWVINNMYKRISKINSSTGAVLRQFNSPAVDYPVGLAWDEANRQLYISDRRSSMGMPQLVYCCDTLGNVIRTMTAPAAIYGIRCVAYRQQYGSVPAHLLAAYTFFNSSAGLDSAGVFELDPADCSVINFFRYFPADTCNIRGIEVDPRNGNYWVGLYQYGT